MNIEIMSMKRKVPKCHKNLNLILDCESSKNSAYNVFIQIKNDKAAIDNTECGVHLFPRSQEAGLEKDLPAHKIFGV